MSDVTELFSGKLSPTAFIEKEWANAMHLADNLPADIQPLAQAVVADAKVVIADAAEFAGTAISAYIASNGGNLGTEVLNLISGAMGGADPTSAAAQDTVKAVTALLQGIVQHGVMSFVSATAPPAPAPH